MNLYRQKVKGLPKKLSGFNCLLHLHASSAAAWFWPSLLQPFLSFWVPSLSLCCLSLISLLCPSGTSPKMSAFPTFVLPQHQTSSSVPWRLHSIRSALQRWYVDRTVSFLSSCFQNTFSFLCQSVSGSVWFNFSLWKYRAEFSLMTGGQQCVDLAVSRKKRDFFRLNISSRTLFPYFISLSFTLATY